MNPVVYYEIELNVGETENVTLTIRLDHARLYHQRNVLLLQSYGHLFDPGEE